MQGRLQDKYVFVTGAGRGLGSSIALGLAEQGAHVAVHYNQSQSGAEEVAEQIRKLGRKAMTVQADIGNWESVRVAVAQVTEQFGRIDVLVNNVGDVAPEQMSWRDITEESIDRVLDVDIKGTMLMTHEVGLRMLEQGGGAIVNIGSHVVLSGSPRAPQYAAAKYGIIGLTKSYAHAFAPTVRVNTIGPGFIETDTTTSREDWQSGRRERILAQTPLNHIPKPEEMVGVVTFLACDDSRNMTGTFMVVDGGYGMVGA